MFMLARRRLIPSLNSKMLVNVLLTPATNFLNISKVTTPISSARFKHVHTPIPGTQTQSVGTRYAPPSPLEEAEEFISSALSNQRSMSEEEWDNFKSDLMDKEHFVTEESFSSIVMGTLLTSNQLELGQNFLKYVENSCVKPNFLTYLKYISLCSKNRRLVNQEHILKMIEKVKKQIDESPVLDGKRAEYIIQGLCATDRWRESLNYLDKLFSKPSREMCSSIACAAVRNNDEKFAWEILTKWVNPYEPVNDRVIEEYLLVALKMQQTDGWKSDKFIEKLFQYMQVRDVIISVDVAKLIEQYFSCHQMKWNVTYTKVSRKGGFCENCGQSLNLFNLNSRDFSDLQEGFLSRAVMKSDLYINSSKREFKEYMQFIDEYKPFHIVVDALNTAYTFQGFPSRKNLSIHLLHAVRKLAGNTRKLLVLGRKHMKSWPDIHKVSGRARLFFTDNISQDDPFVIHATLASGPHTFFVSGDLMRDHLSRLDDPRLIYLFKRWQLSQQIYAKSDEKNNITFIEPVRHSITAQGSMENGWHIPFDDKIILDPYEELNNWICIKKCI